MNKRGPILIIEDDPDDRHILSVIFQELKCSNEICFFGDGFSLLLYLENDSVDPFLILSDIHMPRLDGFELKRQINANERLAAKNIPYLFFSTAIHKYTLHQAGMTAVHGLFQKPATYDGYLNLIRKIIGYWQECYTFDHHYSGVRPGPGFYDVKAVGESQVDKME